MKAFAMALLSLAAGCCCLAAALPAGKARLVRSSSSTFFDLPSNASVVVGTVRTGFSCDELPYGYYGDIDNDCKIFHICLPIINHGTIVPYHYVFICPEGTVFDQINLVCSYPELAPPCSNSFEYRKVNEYFGQTESDFLQ